MNTNNNVNTINIGNDTQMGSKIGNQTQKNKSGSMNANFRN